MSGHLEKGVLAGLSLLTGNGKQRQIVAHLLPGIALFSSLGGSGEKDAGRDGDDNIA